MRMETSSPKHYLGFGMTPQAGRGWRRLPAPMPRLVGRTAHQAPALRAAQEGDTTRRGELPAKNSPPQSPSLVRGRDNPPAGGWLPQGGRKGRPYNLIFSDLVSLRRRRRSSVKRRFTSEATEFTEWTGALFLRGLCGASFLRVSSFEFRESAIENRKSAIPESWILNPV